MILFEVQVGLISRIYASKILHLDSSHLFQLPPCRYWLPGFIDVAGELYVAFMIGTLPPATGS